MVKRGIGYDGDISLEIPYYHKMLTGRAKAVLEKRFECKICHKAFPSNWHLKIHSRIHTGVKPFECADCGSAFSRKDYLEKHTRVHTGERPFKCEVCGKSFTQKGHLQDHFPIHTDEKPYVCEFCGKSFLIQSNLRQHVSIHTDERPYSCAICSKSFREKRHIKIHLQTHLAVKPFICEFCGKSFLLKSNLKLHLIHHKGEKLFSCDVCGKTFVDKSNLQRHTYVHTGEQPYTCNICGKSSSRKEFLKDHSFIHTGEKPYDCKFCDEKYRFRTNLRQHMRSKHGTLLSSTTVQVTNKIANDIIQNKDTFKKRAPRFDSLTVAKSKKIVQFSAQKSKSQTVDQKLEANDYSNHSTPVAENSLSDEIIQVSEEQTDNRFTCSAAESCQALSYDMVVLPEEKTNGYSKRIHSSAVNNTREIVQPPDEKKISVDCGGSNSTLAQETNFNQQLKISENTGFCDQFAVVGFLRKINKTPEVSQSTGRREISYVCGHCNFAFISSIEFEQHIQTHRESVDALEERSYLQLLLTCGAKSKNVQSSLLTEENRI